MSKHTDTQEQKGIKAPKYAGDIPVVPDLQKGSFVFQHHVAWGDCDPAQIAYTANIPRWGLLALEDWYRSRIGYDWFTLNMELGVGTPFVSLQFNFVAPVKPPEHLEIVVKVLKIGKSSITHQVNGFQQGSLSFEGETVAVFVNAVNMKPIPIPPNIRTCIKQFVSGQNDEYPVE